jgi:kinesin family protein 18/19
LFIDLTSFQLEESRSRNITFDFTWCMTLVFQVAVRCRPLSAKEKLKTRDILRVVDGKVVVVLDPDLSKEYLDRVQNRSKEKKYAFDVAFSPESTNEDVYNATVSSMVEGVVRGLNATIFAYGATGRCST